MGWRLATLRLLLLAQAVLGGYEYRIQVINVTTFDGTAGNALWAIEVLRFNVVQGSQQYCTLCPVNGEIRTCSQVREWGDGVPDFQFLSLGMHHRQPSETAGVCEYERNPVTCRNACVVPVGTESAKFNTTCTCFKRYYMGIEVDWHVDAVPQDRSFPWWVLPVGGFAALVVGYGFGSLAYRVVVRIGRTSYRPTLSVSAHSQSTAPSVSTYSLFTRTLPTVTTYISSAPPADETACGGLEATSAIDVDSVALSEGDVRTARSVTPEMTPHLPPC